MTYVDRNPSLPVLVRCSMTKRIVAEYAADLVDLGHVGLNLVCW